MSKNFWLLKVSEQRSLTRPFNKQPQRRPKPAGLGGPGSYCTRFSRLHESQEPESDVTSQNCWGQPEEVGAKKKKKKVKKGISWFGILKSSKM